MKKNNFQIHSNECIEICWMKFWIFFILPFGALGDIIGGFIYYSYYYTISFYLFIFVLALAVFNLTVSYGLYKRRMWAWKLNWLLIYFTPLNLLLKLFSSPRRYIYIYLVFFIVFCIAWIWANDKYWRKRKFLFS